MELYVKLNKLYNYYYIETSKMYGNLNKAMKESGINIDVLETFSNKTQTKNKNFKIFLLALIIIFLVSEMDF